MTEERIAALDAIGMIWDLFDYYWENNYAVATEYYRQNGNLPGSAAAGLPAGNCVGESGEWIGQDCAY